MGFILLSEPGITVTVLENEPEVFSLNIKDIILYIISATLLQWPPSVILYFFMAVCTM